MMIFDFLQPPVGEVGAYLAHRGIDTEQNHLDLAPSGLNKAVFSFRPSPLWGVYIYSHTL